MHLKREVIKIKFLKENIENLIFHFEVALAVNSNIRLGIRNVSDKHFCGLYYQTFMALKLYLSIVT